MGSSWGWSRNHAEALTRNTPDMACKQEMAGDRKRPPQKQTPCSGPLFRPCCKWGTGRKRKGGDIEGTMAQCGRSIF
ncbi:hypothetical protein NDU88_007503 [Pleurodeles waltl]|uniref:Uncharacterized protein n=1 Tax=Pleurodeles waltl TaxID=8319 RepID=A0AAV7QRW2_PLEWA|nr:hypothetical protein NDU88_007503 [Pleurodeles waltl]